jgi:hypothetical protein
MPPTIDATNLTWSLLVHKPKTFETAESRDRDHIAPTSVVMSSQPNRFAPRGQFGRPGAPSRLLARRAVCFIQLVQQPPAMKRPEKIAIGEMRSSGVTGVLGKTGTMTSAVNENAIATAHS